MSDLIAKLDERIATCDAEIERVRTQSATTIQELKDNKAVLLKAKLMLAANPDAEALIAQLRTLGAF